MDAVRPTLSLLAPNAIKYHEVSPRNIDFSHLLPTAAKTVVTGTDENGEKYTGKFEDDLRHGKGTYTYPDGGKYVGEWKNGIMHGEGTYTYSDGRVEKGLWENDKFLGEE